MKMDEQVTLRLTEISRSKAQALRAKANIVSEAPVEANQAVSAAPTVNGATNELVKQPSKGNLGPMILENTIVSAEVSGT
jgi:hypothetical protein